MLESNNQALEESNQIAEIVKRSTASCGGMGYCGMGRNCRPFIFNNGGTKLASLLSN